MPSTVVADFSYDTINETLRIVFTTGKVYDYKNVPVKVYEDMKASFSKGVYFNNHIRDKYRFEKVEDSRTEF